MSIYSIHADVDPTDSATLDDALAQVKADPTAPAEMADVIRQAAAEGWRVVAVGRCLIDSDKEGRYLLEATRPSASVPRGYTLAERADLPWWEQLDHIKILWIVDQTTSRTVWLDTCHRCPRDGWRTMSLNEATRLLADLPVLGGE